MRVLLTGASGYLGQHILHSFLTEPPPYVQHIYALVQSSSELEIEVNELIRSLGKTCPIQVRVQQVNLTQPDSVDAFLRRYGPMDACIHTAALSSPGLCEQDPDAAERINNPTHFLNNLIESDTFIVALSTDQVYGGDPAQAPFAEADATEPVNAYGRTKVALERHLRDRHAGRSVLLRSSLILGPPAPIAPGLAHETFLQFIASRGRQETTTTFYTDERRSAVYVRDVVACVERCLRGAAAGCDARVGAVPAGVYNLGGPASHSRLDLARAVFDRLGYEALYLRGARRADEPPPPAAGAGGTGVAAQSPLDISMATDKLRAATGLAMTDLSTMVAATFPKL